MSVEQLAEFLLWCAVLNSGLLVLWGLLFLAGRRPMFSIHARWFAVGEEYFAAIHYTGMLFYKIAIVLFTIIPYVALRFFVM